MFRTSFLLVKQSLPWGLIPWVILGPYGFLWKCWVNIPNEIAIFHRDNDQQNHWVIGVHNIFRHTHVKKPDVSGMIYPQLLGGFLWIFPAREPASPTSGRFPLLVLPGGSLGLCLFVGGPCCDGFHRAPGRHLAARQAAGCGRGHVGPVHHAHGAGEGLWAGEKHGWVMRKPMENHGKPWKNHGKPMENHGFTRSFCYEDAWRWRLNLRRSWCKWTCDL